MATWAEFEAAAPDIAAGGRRLLYARGDGEGLLATVRGDDRPRIHPINVGVVDGGLYAFLLKSAKRVDLELDGRYAIHAHQDPADPAEFSVRGRARLVDDADVREAVGGSWFFTVDETYELFEFSIDSAVLGLRGPDEWPPRYSRWAAA
jgi:dipeptidyl aminopeptidase/acylaminoacyl peptidase